MNLELLKNVPDELKAIPAWVVWRYEPVAGRDKPTKVPYNPSNGRKASNANPEDWVSFDYAVSALTALPDAYSGLGFVLSPADNVGFIDLDDPSDILDPEKKAEAIARLNWVYANCPVTYTEKSPSGTGVHLLVSCSTDCIPRGRRSGKIEIYTTGRYMTVTGDVLEGRNVPMAPADEFMKRLYDNLGEGKDTADRPVVVEAGEQTHSDEEVVRIATNFENGDKFMDLYYGRFEEYYGSQSEADQALINMIQFVSKNPEQIARVFRASELGQRAKAQRNDYVETSIRKAFDRELPPVDTASLREQFDAAVLERTAKVASEALIATQAEPLPDNPTFAVASGYKGISFPPGLVGAIASYIYHSAPRPVPEIAIAGAIGLMAGICGRAFSISGSGLNVYLVLLAPTGTGKEAINSGVNRLMNTVADVCNDDEILKFVGPSKIASPEALQRHLIEDSKSFMSVMGEVGIMLGAMTGPNVSESKSGLRRIFLDLYSKSDPGQVMQGMVYAKASDSKKAVKSPAFSLVGESTPERFYEALTEELVSEGLMPRFTTIEYRGDRVPLNKNAHKVKPPSDLVDALSELAMNAVFWNKTDENVEVTLSAKADQLMDAFNTECDAAINDGIRKMREGQGSMEVLQQLWNRGHLKALRLAGLIACGMPYVDHKPQVSLDVARWSIDLIRADIMAMQRRFEAGDIGVSASGPDENKQVQEAERAIKSFMSAASTPDALRAYGVSPKMVQSYCIPYTYLHRKLANLAPFRKDRQGGTQAVKRVLDVLIARGDLRPETKMSMIEKFESQAMGYTVTNIWNFIERS